MIVDGEFFEEPGGRYVASWDEHAVDIKFARVRPDRAGDLTAELEAWSFSGERGLLHQGRVNLLGTRSRQEIARHIAQRDPLADRRDWDGMIEWAARRVVLATRRGSPAVYFRDVPDAGPEATGYALPPLVLATMPTFIFGDGGTGKSLVALAVAAAVNSGKPVAGMTPDKARNVALLDWEMDAAEHRKRLGQLVAGDLPDILYVPCARPLAEDVDRLRDVIAEHGIELVIVDSVALACDGPPEAADVAARFFGALRQLEVGALCIAHVNRAGDPDRPFGSTFWHNGARLTWYAKREADPTADELSVGLFAKKSNTGPLPAPVGLRFTFSDRRIAVSRTDVATVSDFAAHVPLRVRLAAQMRTGARTIAEMAEQLDVPSDSVRKALERGEGKWCRRIEGADRVFRWGLAA